MMGDDEGGEEEDSDSVSYPSPVRFRHNSNTSAGERASDRQS